MFSEATVNSRNKENNERTTKTMLNDQRSEFIAAYDEYADAIYRYCFFRVYSQSKAEELTQETFMKAWQYIQKGNKIENIRAFLYRISRNLIVDSFRKDGGVSNKKTESLEGLIERSGNAAEPVYDGKKDVEDEVMVNETIDAMKCLSSDHREVLTMRYVEGLHPREIAAALDADPQNVSAKIYRAMRKLRKCMHII